MKPKLFLTVSVVALAALLIGVWPMHVRGQNSNKNRDVRPKLTGQRNISQYIPISLTVPPSIAQGLPFTVNVALSHTNDKTTELPISFVAQPLLSQTSPDFWSAGVA